MTTGIVVEKLIRSYNNLKAELEIAYEHNLSYNIINSLHHDLYQIEKALKKHGVGEKEKL